MAEKTNALPDLERTAAAANRCGSLRRRRTTKEEEKIAKLSGSPLTQEQSEPEMKNPKLSRRVSKRQDKKITVEHLEKMYQKNVSPLWMKRLMRVVQNGNLSTLDEELPSSTDEDEASLRIKDDKSAKATAKKIFRNVVNARSK
ncbi:Mechanosensitive ion channel protein 8 [Camellia lanceoleosa]|uniref:Mechanosensitive ion channel protein 8 n=1 Tax=Camellia lanceoleosa TaxID=1840588 RepID=A0ACC0HP79_9ERIC|nr:Mechanosensitive ion channel protein 8 [Camellia lanceoleosa]